MEENMILLKDIHFLFSNIEYEEKKIK